MFWRKDGRYQFFCVSLWGAYRKKLRSQVKTNEHVHHENFRRSPMGAPHGANHIAFEFHRQPNAWHRTLSWRPGRELCAQPCGRYDLSEHRPSSSGMDFVDLRLQSHGPAIDRRHRRQNVAPMAQCDNKRWPTAHSRARMDTRLRPFLGQYRRWRKGFSAIRLAWTMLESQSSATHVSSRLR